MDHHYQYLVHPLHQHFGLDVRVIRLKDLHPIRVHVVGQRKDENGLEVQLLHELCRKVTCTEHIHQGNPIVAHVVEGHASEFIRNSLATVRRINGKDLSVQSHVHFREEIKDAELALHQVHESEDFPELLVLARRCCGLSNRVRGWPLHVPVEEYADDLSGRRHRLEGAPVLDALRGVVHELLALTQFQVRVQRFVLGEEEEEKEMGIEKKNLIK